MPPMAQILLLALIFEITRVLFYLTPTALLIFAIHQAASCRFASVFLFRGAGPSLLMIWSQG
jgi:hypothetical protein